MVLVSWLGQSVAGYSLALAAVALVSVAISFMLDRVHLANVSMLYLLAVLGTAVAFGRGPAVAASLAAFATFNFFFVEPRHTLVVADPAEWIALLLFLATAVITGQLAADQRRRADEARRREREALVLYDVLRLLTGPDLGQALQAVAERLRHELQLAAVVIDVEPTAGAEAARAVDGDAKAVDAASGSLAPMHVLGPMRNPVEGSERPRRWVRLLPPRVPGAFRRTDTGRLHQVPVELSGRRIASIVLLAGPERPAFGRADDRLLTAVAGQLAQALERVRLRQEATEAEVLGRSSELKTALVNAVSHDLRTPLASIIASAGSLRQEGVDWPADARRELAANIEQEAQRLNRIIGNLLDLSRIEGDSLVPEKGWYDLGALVDDVLGRLRPLLSRHPVTVDVPESLPPVPLDYVEIDQVLTNLLENSARYAPASTEIRVAARELDGVVEIEVTDRGPGIPERDLPQIFEPFFRIGGATPRPTGTGLGLAVVRGLVEAHGGQISAENRPDGGTRVVFTLPLGENGAPIPPFAGTAARRSRPGS